MADSGRSKPSDADLLAQDMRGFGATEEQISSAIKHIEQTSSREHNEYIVEHDNWESWDVFRRCGTQWRIAQMSGRVLGLDYSAVSAIINMTGSSDQMKVFDGVQLIEAGYLSKQNHG